MIYLIICKFRELELTADRCVAPPSPYCAVCVLMRCFVISMIYCTIEYIDDCVIDEYICMVGRVAAHRQPMCGSQERGGGGDVKTVDLTIKSRGVPETSSLYIFFTQIRQSISNDVCFTLKSIQQKYTSQQRALLSARGTVRTAMTSPSLHPPPVSLMYLVQLTLVIAYFRFNMVYRVNGLMDYTISIYTFG